MHAGSNSPLVSIITPAFNASAVLHETVASALEQTLTNFELLIVDDASTDHTFELARQWTAVDRRVHAWTIRHGGPAAARNAAMAAARGKFFALLDSDDVWAPTFLENQIELLTRHEGISVVTANALSRGGNLDGQPLWPLTRDGLELRFLDLILHEDAVCIMSVFRREVADRIGGFDPRFTGNEDYHFWLRAAAAGFVFLQNPTPLGLYRRSAGSLSANERRMLQGICCVLRDIATTQALRIEERHAIDAQLRRFEDELVKLDVRGCLDRRDADAAVRSLQTWATLRGHGWLATLSSVAALWPQPMVWLYDLRRTLRSASSDSRP